MKHTFNITREAVDLEHYKMGYWFGMMFYAVLKNSALTGQRSAS